MADFPSKIWIRKPVLDGFTTIDRAMTLLDQSREEVAAIETELGTKPATDYYNTVEERLNTRLSKSGHARGRMQPLRKWNDAGGFQFINEPVLGWWEKDPEITPLYVLTAISSVQTDANPLVTFPIVYGRRPDAVIARYTSNSSVALIGSVVVKDAAISKTGFNARVLAFASDKLSWGAPDRNYWISYIAIGGAP